VLNKIYFFILIHSFFFLLTASEKGHIDIIDYLFSKGADVNVKNNWAWTSLHSGE